MILTRYTDDGTDGILKKVLIPQVKSHMQRSNDDCLILTVGTTGTGKSHLNMHMVENYSYGKADIGQVCLNREDFALNLDRVAKMEDVDKKVLLFDEFDAARRQGSSKWNIQIIDTFFKIRGLKIFHLWCCPSLEWIDRKFVTERIRAIIFIDDKREGSRDYYYISNFDTDMMVVKILDEFGDLSLPTLRKVAKNPHKFVKYRGWFRRYDGYLRSAYDEKKDEKMVNVTETFRDAWVPREKQKEYVPDFKQDWYKVSEAVRMTGYAADTIKTIMRVMGWKQRPDLYRALSNAGYLHMNCIAMLKMRRQGLPVVDCTLNVQGGVGSHLGEVGGGTATFTHSQRNEPGGKIKSNFDNYHKLKRELKLKNELASVQLKST